MRYSTLGESLWVQWDGEGIELTLPDSIIYYTDGLVDIHHPVVERALAAAIQHDGTADTLGMAYKSLAEAVTTQGYYGVVQDEDFLVACDEDGTNYYAYDIPTPNAATWVEVPANG